MHTGQHYDENMSKVFFEEMKIPYPDYNLSVGSGSHGAQTAKMLSGLEEIYLKEKPDAIVVYGDTNSTIAGALAASKIHIPVIHIEAGLRSFNKRMPEEINRISCDHMSTLLFTPTSTGLENLKKEGFSLENSGNADLDNPHVYHCGDIMYDNSLYFSNVTEDAEELYNSLGVKEGQYILATVHRDSNTDIPENLEQIFRSFVDATEKFELDIILPLHPRTKNKMDENLSSELRDRINASGRLKIIPPAGFLDIIKLEKGARLMMTDSGGLQKESFFFKKPCVILRPQTEWIEIVENGNAILADHDYNRIMKGVEDLLSKTDFTYPEFYGDGKAAEFICNKIIQEIN